MAIVSMKKLVLIGCGKDKSKVLKCLHKTGCVEVARTSELENTYRKEDTNLKEEVGTKLSRLSFVFSFLKAERRIADNLVKAELFEYVAPKSPLIKPTPRFAFDDFNQIVEREDEIFSEVSELELLNQRYVEIKSEILKLQSLIEQVKVFSPITCKLNAFRDTKNTTISLGAVPAGKIGGIDTIKNDYPMAYIDVAEGRKYVPVIIIALKEQRDEILARFNEVEFVKTSFVFDMTAEEKVAESEARIAELEAEKLVMLSKSLDKQSKYPDFKQLFDYYTIENAKLQAADGFALTKSTFILEGWLPTSEETRVTTVLKEISDAIVVETLDAVEGDTVPTCTVNNKVVGAYECITNMYSVPSIKDIDPNPFVAFFYFLLFGMMMGDAIYGLFLMVAGFTVYHFMRPVPGKGKLVLVIAMGGISTFFWGILFGGYMAFPIDNTFLAKLRWFNPLDPDGAIMMLVVSLAVGVFQILFAMGIKAYMLIKDGHWFDALCDIGSWYMAFLGIGLFAASGAMKVPALKTVGIV
ncbi:MAG: V-type ATPase 116kDa subunit family protein, partial [Clostridia bacterium]